MIFSEKYDCIYRASGLVGINAAKARQEVSVPLGHYACYSAIYLKIKPYKYAEVTYEIYLFAKNLEDHQFNLCTKAETKKILRCLQKTVPFKYHFRKDNYTVGAFTKETTDYNVLTVTIKGTYSQHVWITSMLRCFFEWPYNIAAKEACQLQSQLKEVDGVNFAKENWINLYLTIAAQLGSYHLHGVVDMYTHPKAKTYHEWKEKIASLKSNYTIIGQLRKGGARFSKNIEDVRVCDQESLDAGVQSRASKYVAAYKDKLSWKN